MQIEADVLLCIRTIAKESRVYMPPLRRYTTFIVTYPNPDFGRCACAQLNHSSSIIYMIKRNNSAPNPCVSAPLDKFLKHHPFISCLLFKTKGLHQYFLFYNIFCYACIRQSVVIFSVPFSCGWSKSDEFLAL